MLLVVSFIAFLVTLGLHRTRTTNPLSERWVTPAAMLTVTIGCIGGWATDRAWGRALAVAVAVSFVYETIKALRQKPAGAPVP